MANSMVTHLPTAQVTQEIFPNSFPPELLKLIFEHSNVISLMHLSATSQLLRHRVHNFFVSRLSDEAAAHPEVREGLARLGWSKDHKLWTCSCFKLMAGPGFTWRRLNERKRFSAMCRMSLPKIMTTVAGKTFVITSLNELIYWKIPSYSAQGQLSPRSLVSFKNSTISIKCVSSYDNILVISLNKANLRREYLQPPTNRTFAIRVYNPSTLRKVTDIELNTCGGGISEGDIGTVTVKGITFAKNTMIVRLDYVRAGEGLCTEFQMWKINSAKPQEEGSSLTNIISHRNSPLSQYLDDFISFLPQGDFCVNDRFIVMLDEDADEVKVFQRNEEAVFIRKLELGRKPLTGIALDKGQGDFIALAFRYYAVGNHRYPAKLLVQVYSASRGDLVVQQVFTQFPSLSLRYMQWFGHHLIVVLEQDSSLTIMSWQQGLTSFLTCPLKVNVLGKPPDCGGGCISNRHVDCLHVDYRGITSAAQKICYNGNQEVYFRTWDSC